MSVSSFNNNTITLSFTVTMALNGGANAISGSEYKAICDRVQSTTLKAFSNTSAVSELYPQQLTTMSTTDSDHSRLGTKYVEPPQKHFFGTKSIVPAHVVHAKPEDRISSKDVAPFVFANPTFHPGSTFQNVGAQASQSNYSSTQHPTVICGSELLHRVVSAIGHRKQTFTHAKHRYDVNRMKNVFHSRREMQVNEHRIKAYLMHSLSPMEKEVLNVTSEYRNHHLTSAEQIILADKSRNIKKRIHRQYNKLMKTMFGSAQSTENDTWIVANYSQHSHIMPYSQ